MTTNSSHSSMSRRAGEPLLVRAPLAPLASRVSAAEAPLPAAASDRRTAARLLIASLRLPAVGAAEAAADPLMAALAPLAGDRRTLWIGLPSVAAPPAPPREQLGEGVAGVIQAGGAAQRPVDLSAEERRSCDDGLVQHALWPLFHDMAPLARFELQDWQAFRSINRKFARAVAQVLARGTGQDLLWVHEPLLMGLAAALRRRRSPAAATFFLHLPFPAADSFLRLPWRESLLASLLAYRRIGFQTRRDLGNFLAAVQLIFPEVAASSVGDGVWQLCGQSGARSCACLAGVYPEGVDAAGIAAAAAAPEVEQRAAFLRAATAGHWPSAPAFPGSQSVTAPSHKIVLALDSLDAAQGTVLKLRAFAAALERQPAWRESATLLLHLTPSPLAGSHEKGAALELRREVERTVGEINGRLGKAGRVPVHYRFGEIASSELLALYRAADIALVTPLRSGMEIIAKSYCAADIAEKGILVLSEFAGAAAQLRGAWLVNPHDVEATAQTLLAALRSQPARPARDGSAAIPSTAATVERRREMHSLRSEVRRHDLSWWMRKLLPEALAEPGANG
jgi:trehalose 6-phosphate synthase/phosphatase